MENFISNQYGEKLATLNTENINICWSITKPGVTKMQLFCIFFHVCWIFAENLNFQFPKVSQGSVATCLRWDGYCRIGFVANFIRFPAVQKFWKSVKIWQSYREFKGGNFFETQCIQDDKDAICYYCLWSTGQCCRRHVVSQPVVSDISVVRSTVVFVACILNLIIVI